MTPDRAASVFRELMQTPREELGYFPRRAGLMTSPPHADLERAQELLYALAQALESGPGSHWQRVESAWVGMRQQHGVMQQTITPQRPEWVRELPAMPSLGDPAPGTAAYQQQEERRARFVPVAPPASLSPAAPLSPAAAVSPAAYASPTPVAPSPPVPVPPAPVYGESYALGPPPQVQPPAQPYGHPVAPSGGYGYQQPPAPPPAPQPAAPPRPPPPRQPGLHETTPPLQPAPQETPPLQPGWQETTPPLQPGLQETTPPLQPAPPLPQSPPPARAQSQDARRTQPIIPADGTIDPSRWTVSRYAAFCAACAAYPERVAHTQEEYGIAGAAGRQLLDDYWADRFDEEAGLQQQWEQLFSQFRGQLAQRR